MEKRIKMRICADKPSKPFRPFFNAVGYVNVDFTLTAATEHMYDYLSSFHNHFRYIRMHNTLTAHGQAERFLLEGERILETPDT